MTRTASPDILEVCKYVLQVIADLKVREDLEWPIHESPSVMGELLKCEYKLLRVVEKHTERDTLTRLSALVDEASKLRYALDRLIEEASKLEA